VCSLARATDRDIARAAEALVGGASTRITFSSHSALAHKEAAHYARPLFAQAKLSTRLDATCRATRVLPRTATAPTPTSCPVLEAVINECADHDQRARHRRLRYPSSMAGFIPDLRTRIPKCRTRRFWSGARHNDLVMAWGANSLRRRDDPAHVQFEVHDQRAGERRRNVARRSIASDSGATTINRDIGIDATHIGGLALVRATPDSVVAPNKAVSGRERSRIPAFTQYVLLKARRHLRDHAAEMSAGREQDRAGQALVRTPSSSASRNSASRWNPRPRSTPLRTLQGLPSKSAHLRQTSSLW